MSDVIELGDNGEFEPYSLAGMIEICAIKSIKSDEAVVLSQVTSHIIRTLGQDGIALCKEELMKLHPDIPNDTQLNRAFCGSLIKYARNMLNITEHMTQDPLTPDGVAALIPSNLGSDDFIEKIVAASKMGVEFQGKSQSAAKKR